MIASSTAFIYGVMNIGSCLIRNLFELRFLLLFSFSPELIELVSPVLSLPHTYIWLLSKASIYPD
jgi:hypothetical protein